MPPSRRATSPPAEATSTPKRRVGRPRSEEATAAVLDVAYLLTASDGLKGATIEAIAEASAVSKVTIYKWWDDRAALLIDAYLWRTRQELPLTEDEDPVRAIHAHVLRYVAALKGDLGRVLLAVLGECMTKSGSTAVFTRRYLAERRDLGVRVISSGQRSGAIRSKRPAAALYDQIFGTIFYRFLFGLDELSKPYLTSLIDSTFSDGRPDKA
jgi:AcrR family transcriptional regulator